jgi:hypothetical protein
MSVPFSLVCFRLLIAVFLLGSLSAGTLADPGKQWWKGNLHTHSLWSDGDDYPEMIADWYKQCGYHFLALSDHNILSDQVRWIGIPKSRGGEAAFAKYLARFGEAWVEQREFEGERQVRLKMLSEFRGRFEAPGRFLMIQSEEITDHFLSTPIHINATNVRELIKPQGGRSVVEVMQQNIDAVLAQRTASGVPMFAHINHPNFQWALTAEELMQVEREQFFEVYNGHPSVNNAGSDIRASVERIWDIVLTKRIEAGKPPLFGLGTDDSHNYHSEADPKKRSRPGRGWVMVRAESLGTDKLIAALEAGDFYASSGVVLKDVRRHLNGIELEIDAQPGITYRTEFIGTRKGYDATSEPVLGKEGESLRTTRRYSKDVGTVLATADGTSARYDFKDREIYVRARVTSSVLKADPSRPGEFEQAWTQPVVASRP